MECIQQNGLGIEVVGALALWGEAERWGLFQPEAGMALGAPNSSLPNACREVVKEMEPGPSKLCVVGGRGTVGIY